MNYQGSIVGQIHVEHSLCQTPEPLAFMPHAKPQHGDIVQIIKNRYILNILVV